MRDKYKDLNFPRWPDVPRWPMKAWHTPEEKIQINQKRPRGYFPESRYQLPQYFGQEYTELYSEDIQWADLLMAWNDKDVAGIIIRTPSVVSENTNCYTFKAVGWDQKVLLTMMYVITHTI